MSDKTSTSSKDTPAPPVATATKTPPATSKTPQKEITLASGEKVQAQQLTIDESTHLLLAELQKEMTSGDPAVERLAKRLWMIGSCAVGHGGEDHEGAVIRAPVPPPPEAATASAKH